MEFDSIVSKKKSECTREYLGQTVAGSIVLIDVINSGSFGDIYHGRDKKTGKEYAVKFNKNETERGFRNFYKEYDIMKLLKGKGMFPTCSIEYRGANKVGKDVLIMEKLGLNVYDLFRICNKSLSPWTMSFLIQQFILRMKELHACGIVHRDIKPENFCIANPYCYDVYLIDFGLSKDYLDEEGNRRPKHDNEGFVGTPRYSSRHAHKGILLSRRNNPRASR
jgi:serine/threonine protein kinase